MKDVTIAVIGSQGVGKSAFIQNALDMPAVPATAITSAERVINGMLSWVSLVEFDIEALDFHTDRPLVWPGEIAGALLHGFDSALVLYDVLNKDSIMKLPNILNALVFSDVPTILVACKCDIPSQYRALDADSIAAACGERIEVLKVANNKPESARQCLKASVRAALAITARESSRAFRGEATTSQTAPRPVSRSPENSDGLRHRDPMMSYSQHLKRQQAVRRDSSPEATEDASWGSPTLPTRSRHHSTSQMSCGASPRSPPSALQTSRVREQSSFSAESRNPMGNERDDGPSLVAKKSHDEDGFNPVLVFQQADLPILQRHSEEGKSHKNHGVSFDQLVDRLLGQYISKTDGNFQDIFLCLYRKFAAPQELFSAIDSRLALAVRDKSIHPLMRTMAQLRIINVIARWLASYPGDFAGWRTTQLLKDLIQRLYGEPAFSAAAHEMQTALRLYVIANDDTAWATTDHDVLSPDIQVFDSTKSSANTSLRADSMLRTNASEDFLNKQTDVRNGRRPSEAPSITFVDHDSREDCDTETCPTVEDYELEAAALVPTSTLPLTKFRYHMLMDTSDEAFANEMTRIDWIMFSSIRVRDLVRHVTLSFTEKEKCKSLSNVNRMIDHFNHIARWVANMILMRDKAKHRAQVLEKFMRIALKLRQLNNYNGLAAVIAGINGSAVHRLGQTRSLVSPECHKRFMRLELLMSSQKSHFAYRLAWENSSLPRIPFIPLHRRDLVSAEEGSRTFVGHAGDRINWKKFDILGEVLLPIIKSQGTTYARLEKHEMARELILDCNMSMDEEEIYQRSVQLEGSSASTADLKKKFPWIQK